MTFSLKHTFSSPKADGTDATLVQPSNWNAEHTITLGAGKVLGRDASGAGAVQELPLSFDATGQSMIPPSGTTASRPATPLAGMVRFNTSTSKFELYNGTAWGSVGGGASISDTAPSSAAAGDLWWKSDEGQMYVYYTDANSSQWVVANMFAGGAGVYLPLTGGAISGSLTIGGVPAVAVTPGTSGNVLTSTGSAWASSAPSSIVPTPTAIGQIPFSTNGSTYTATQKIVQGTAVASTSGTAIDFTSIPSWVKRITVMFNVMSTSGTSSVQAQIGSTSGGIENTGYTCLLSVSQSGVQYYPIATGFGITGGTSGGWTAAAYVYTGLINLTSFGSNIWVADIRLSGGSATSNQYFGTGYKTLSDVLSQVRITTVNGTDSFDAGSINILYE
ncbi:hypothetical protein UFOVP55_74 [uncultured Caudovirales phage]|uniref:Uncharacterized protein n=1 Tax=uncultured Caudovirales phage TaxID=2100421 RepID=A0A6J5KW25_9CAUD|nr:hypothetical protein UFOVP55_74 [uncultured Caudovirales phage]